MGNSISRVNNALGKIYNGEVELKNPWRVAEFLESKLARLEHINPPSPLLGADEFD